MPSNVVYMFRCGRCRATEVIRQGEASQTSYIKQDSDGESLCPACMYQKRGQEHGA